MQQALHAAANSPGYPLTIGLSEAVSPLRIRGMVGMLGRVQRQVRAAVA